MSKLIDRLFVVHDALTAEGFPHAFGGAIALAYCTEEPRGTRDLDVNIFVDSSQAETALDALPDQVAVAAEDVATVVRDGQTRLWWDDTPIDIFLNNLPLHEAVAAGVVWVPLSGRDIPVLDCASLVIFKAFFDRTKDWADIEAVGEVAPQSLEEAAAAIANLVGEHDSAYRRLQSVLSTGSMSRD